MRESKYPHIEDMLRKYSVSAHVEIREFLKLNIPDSVIRNELARVIADKIMSDYIPSDIEKIKEESVDYYSTKTRFSIEYYVVRPEDIQEIIMNEVKRYTEHLMPEYITP